MGNSRLCVNFTFKITAMFTASDSKYLSDNQWYMPYNELLAAFNWEIIGYSSEERPILNTTLGSGSRSICMWAGMHGNETTGVFMLLSLIDLYTRKKIDLSAFSIHIIPVINPDAYVRFTRRNGLSIDLNRDFRAFQTIESAKLIGWIKMKSPELCLNLHDQRSIFHVNKEPAYTSFLVPSADVSRAMTPLRRAVMNRVGNALRTMGVPLEGIGRYSDEFYPTAVGDYLMAQGIPNVLFESGVSVDDFERMKARLFGLNAMVALLHADDKPSAVYDALPQNKEGQLEWVFTGVLYARMRVDIAVKRVYYVNGHAQGMYYMVDELGDLASRPRMKETDGAAMALSAPLIIGQPITAVLGEVVFENGLIVG
jgi:hypothetical protein